MSLITFCIRIALAAYVVALLALYFMQDRMLLPASPDGRDLAPRLAGDRG